MKPYIIRDMHLKFWSRVSSHRPCFWRKVCECLHHAFLIFQQHFFDPSKSLAAGGFVTSADVPINDLSSDHFSMRVPGHLLFLSTLWSGPFSGWEWPFPDSRIQTHSSFFLVMILWFTNDLNRISGSKDWQTITYSIKGTKWVMQQEYGDWSVSYTHLTLPTILLV